MYDADGLKRYVAMNSPGWGMVDIGTQVPVYDIADFQTLATGSADLLRVATEAR